MIDPRLLQRARTAVRIVAELRLDPQRWTAIAALIHELTRAVHARSELRLRAALAELERSGATRSGGVISDPDDDADGTLLETVETAQDDAPHGLVAKLHEIAADLEDLAAEIRRFPHLDTDTDLPVRPGMTFVVSVYLDTTPPRADESARAFVLSKSAASVGELIVDVWLTATAHFAINGSSTATIILRPHADQSTVASFTVSVRDPMPADDGPPALRATFDFKLRGSGLVRRQVPILLPDGQLLGSPNRSEVGAVLVQGRAEAPDLEVVIKHRLGNAHQYDVLIRTGLVGGISWQDTWTLEEGSEAFVKRLMADFVDKNATPIGRRRSLESAGLKFFDAAPARFRELYWRLVDAGTPPKTMLLISDERAVPWELMIPRRRRDDGSWQTMEPLGAECAIGRWHNSNREDAQHLSPSQRIPLSNSLVLAPDYPAGRTLPKAAAERDLVLEWFPGHIVPATFDELDSFYASHNASLLHFVCHGRDETLQAIMLLKNQTLTAQQVVTSGLGAACQASRPLIFLNACEVGRPGAGLASVGGFPASFIESDASGIIAPLWAVDDGVAHQVAMEFYATVRKDPTLPFADILRTLRSRAYIDGGADSFAAYCFYGDPLAAASHT